MIGDNIRALRRERGMSQEQLAVGLHVVRQTISKWEKGLSVPDADMLVQLAALLQVPVSQLLGSPAPTAPSAPTAELSEQLAQLNQQLAQQVRAYRTLRQIENKRHLILCLTFLALLLAMALRRCPVAAAVAVGLCILAALAVLYRNLALLTSPTDGNCRLGAIRVTTLFHVVLLLLCTAVAVLLGTGMLKLTQNSEKWLAAAILSVVILFSGAVSPKLPFNRHTGLRLPWTVRDRDTWDLAHRLLGIISPAAVVLYIAGLVAVPCFEVVTLAVMCLWLGVPSLLSLVYYTRKMRGRL